MSPEQIIGVSLMVIGGLITAIFSWLIYFLKNRTQTNANLSIRNQESQGIWEFTKKNFPVFIALFGLIMFITGLMMVL